MGAFHRREKLVAKMDGAIEELKTRAEKQEEKVKEDYREKLERRKRRTEETGKKPTGKDPKEPRIKAEESKQQCNLSDPESRVMRKNLRSGYTQSYNAQAGVDTEGSQLIVGNRISQSAGDRAELEPGVECIDERMGKPSSASTDAGYVNGDMIERVQTGAGVEVYCSVHREDAHGERHYDYRPKKKAERKPRAVKDRRIIAMGEKLKTDEGKEICSRRNHTVETAFGIIKEVMGFRNFLLRGFGNVSGEWELVCLSYNLKKLHNLTGA